MKEAERPRVTLKLATSLDGRIALANGQSRWITGEASRQAVHQLRGAHDVVLTGVGTVLADDPHLTVRLPDFAGDQPGRVVMDTRLRTPDTARLFEQGGPLLFICGADVPAHIRSAIEARGASVIALNRYDGPHISLKAAIEQIADLDGESILIEAGARIAGSAIKHDLVDQIEWFRAPMLLGGDGMPVMAALGLERLDEAPIFERISIEECGADLRETYRRKQA
ncbi:RibD family protein [Hyphobacterium sp.]|uniref:RibD family protein n=1 Tax=Hyphobacterium sp. TaxID=2004662 RepID=UPI00374A7CB6